MPRSATRSRKLSAPVDKSSSSSSGNLSDYEDCGSKKVIKKRSTVRRSAGARRSTSAAKRSTSTGRRGRGRRGSNSNIKRRSSSRARSAKGRGSATSRNDSPSSSSSNSYSDDDDYYYKQSASSSGRRRLSSTTGNRRKTQNSSSGRKKKVSNSYARSSGKRSSSQKQKRSKLTGKTTRRRRHSTPLRKAKAKRRAGQRKQKQNAAPLSNRRPGSQTIFEQFQKSLSSLQASLKTDASIDSNKNDDVVLSLPIPQPSSKSVSEIDNNTTLVENDVQQVNSGPSSPTEVQASLKLEVNVESETSSLKVETTEKQVDEQMNSQPSSLNLDTSSSIFSTSSSVELPSPVSSPSDSSFQVTVKSPSLKNPLEAHSVSATPSKESPTTAAVSKTVSDLLDRVEVEQDQGDREEDEEEDNLDDLVISRLEVLKDFVCKVEADLHSSTENKSESAVEQVDNDELVSQKSNRKQSSLNSIEELQQMLNNCIDCLSSSSEDEEKNSSKVVVESSNPLMQQEDKIDVVDNLGESHNLSGISSLSLSIRRAD